jgi:hypothetical protein
VAARALQLFLNAPELERGRGKRDQRCLKPQKKGLGA